VEIPIVAKIHLVVGTATVLAGAGALFFCKGSRLHRASGNLFFLSMLVLATSGIYLSFTRSIELTGLLAIVSLYLVATGWQAAKQKENTVGLFEKWAFGVILASSVACASVGLATAMSETGLQDDLPATGFYFLAGLAAYFGALDFSVIKRGGLAGKQRIARHLWRMCFSMFIAVTIFFLGNSNILPEVLRTPFFLGAPIIAVLVLMIFWLIRVLFTKYLPENIIS